MEYFKQHNIITPVKKGEERMENPSGKSTVPDLYNLIARVANNNA